MRIAFYILLGALSIALFGNRPVAKNFESQPSRYCQIYGSVAVVDDPRMAHYKVYVEESEGLADVIVYDEEIRLYADRVGTWHFTQNPGLADYVIFFEENKHFADFSIYYTDIESFARCNN